MSPDPPPGGNGQVNAHPASIDKLGAALEDRVKLLLTEALTELSECHVEDGAFTTFTYSFSVAYTEAQSFTKVDITHKRDKLEQYRGSLNRTAANWHQAEDKSTPRRGN